MNIGIDASRANQAIKTGTEWYSYHLITQLAQIDRKNQYILYSKDALKGGLENLGSNFKSKVLTWPPKYLWSQIRLSIELLIHPPDVLFVPAHTIPVIHPHRTITTCHDIGFERYPELYATKKIGGNRFISGLLGLMTRIFTLGRYTNTELDYHRFSLRLALKSADKIMVPSQFTAEELMALYPIDKQRIVVNYGSFHGEMFRPIYDQEKLKNSLIRFHIEKPYILFVGRLERKKNIRGTIEAYKLFKEKYQTKHQLILVGKRGFGFSEAEEIINNLPFKNEIIEIGWLEEEDLALILNQADCLFFPSFYEGFGIPPLEAFACGTPVLASNRGSLPEILDQAAIFIDPDQPDKIAEALFKITSDQALRKELIDKGLVRVKAFSWRQCAEKTLALMTEISEK